MDNTAVINGLLAKRAEIQKAINAIEKEARHQTRQHRAELVKIDDAIGLFEPSVTVAKRHQTKFERSIHFVTGELTRRCQTALRDAKGQPVTADAIAVSTMREKHLDVGDGLLRQDITRRFLWTLNRLLTRQAVVKEGWGADARWRLPG